MDCLSVGEIHHHMFENDGVFSSLPNVCFCPLSKFCVECVPELVLEFVPVKDFGIHFSNPVDGGPFRAREISLI